jgi:hypothetical protein
MAASFAARSIASQADFAGSGPLVWVGKPALAAGIVALLLGRDVRAMQTKAGIERAVMGFLEEAPKAPRHCGSWKPRIEGGTGPCSDQFGASSGESQPSIAATNKCLAERNKTCAGANE